MENQTEKTSGYAIYALALLMFVYILNFLDRTIIYILFPLIKKEMAFSDTQLALLGTTSFVIFYTVLGIPFGRLADKGSRTKLIAIGLAIWSLFSGLTAFTWDFWSIFLCRVMVGVGEATLGPAAISLLVRLFSARKTCDRNEHLFNGNRHRCRICRTSRRIFKSFFGWRTAFMIVGFPGIMFAVLVYFLKEPPRDKNIFRPK